MAKAKAVAPEIQNARYETVPVEAGRCQCGCGSYVGFYEHNNRPRGYIKGEPRTFARGHNMKCLPVRTLGNTDYDIAANGCWEWNASRVKGGYGQLRYTARDGVREVKAHRAFYREFVGPIPDGMLVLHRCDNPPCVNPEHLFLGTSLDNTRDMIAKGRQRYLRGSESPHARLTESDALTIRARLRAGESTGSIAKDYDTNYKYIWKIGRGDSWAHIS